VSNLMSITFFSFCCGVLHALFLLKCLDLRRQIFSWHSCFCW
jgi:hypothetical protein